MRFTIRQILLATAFISVVLALIAVSVSLKNRTSELTALQASLNKPVHIRSLRHARAAIRYFRVDDVARRNSFSSLPLAMTTDAKQISANRVDQSVPPEADAMLNLIARYIGSAQDGDVYEVIWTEGPRLPPAASTHNFPTSSKLVKTGGGVATVYESDRWKIQIVDDPAQSPNP